MLTRTKNGIRIAADNKEDFILHLNDAIMMADNPREKLYHQLMKDCGIRWGEVLADGLEQYRGTGNQDGYKDFLANFMVAAADFIIWQIASTLRERIDKDHYEVMFDALYGDLKKRTLQMLVDIEKENPRGEGDD